MHVYCKSFLLLWSCLVVVAVVKEIRNVYTEIRDDFFYDRHIVASCFVAGNVANGRWSHADCIG